jgi:hypothetical protein
MTTRSTPRTKRAAAPKGKKATRAKPPAKLLVAMTGKASAAAPSTATLGQRNLPHPAPFRRP